MTTDSGKGAERAGFRYFLGVLGPGILYAGAAVGLSHLVQSTRAGAIYGLGMTLIILAACVVKYPALRFGGEFSAASGKTLIQNYRDTGWWAIGLYALAQLFSMFFAVAAVTMVNVGLIKNTFGLGFSDLAVAAGLLVLAAALLLTGRYHLLERLTKVIVAIFTVLIVVTTVLVVGRVDWSLGGIVPPQLTPATIAFVIALVGFMPTPMDACVLQSLWTVARGKDRGRLPTPAESRLDFTAGFVISVVLALCFMVLGVGIMHQSGVVPVTDAAGFAAQVMSLFTNAVGDWVYPVIAVAAISVMFSTLLTILDGYPRMVAAIIDTIMPAAAQHGLRSRVYDMAIIVLCVGVVGVIALFLTSFTAFIDLTAAIVFVTGPVLAALNHRAMLSTDVPLADRPGRLMQLWSLAGIGVMVTFAVAFLYLRFLS